MSSLQVRDDGTIVCGHLREADVRVGSNCQVPITSGKSFEQTNAQGTTRFVGDYKEVSAAALETGASRRKAFML